METYKIIKKVDRLDDVLYMAKQEARAFYSNEMTDLEQGYHLEKLDSICKTLELLGIIDSARKMYDTFWINEYNKNKVKENDNTKD